MNPYLDILLMLPFIGLVGWYFISHVTDWRYVFEGFIVMLITIAVVGAFFYGLASLINSVYHV